MIEPVNHDPQTNSFDEAETLFYAERILELANSDYKLLARRLFQQHAVHAQRLLKQEHFNHLRDRADQPDDWSDQKEQMLFRRLKDAAAFNECKEIHDCAHEILLHHDHRADRCPTHHICDEVNEILANNNVHYVEPGEIQINANINATVDFVVESRRSNGGGSPQGNPGFYWTDVLGRRYRGFIKQVDNAQIGDTLKLKITNIPGLTISSKNHVDHILYLEPRVSPGDVIEVELSSLSHTHNSFTFRHHSYDGFLWFKRRGVNKEIFNERTLHAHDRLMVKILYITDEVRRSSRGTITRLGVIKAIPVKRIEETRSPEAHPEIGVATVQG
ncbi:MAG: hypothetical protein GC154_19865 [bacterium]|nr:hypothetical protein [bacterium]